MKTIIEITETHCKIVQCRFYQGRLDPDQSVILCAEIREPSDIDQVLKQWKAQKNRGSSAMLILPRKNAILKQLNLPSTDPDELRQMAGTALFGQIPFQPDEIIFDIDVISQDQQGYSKVLVYILPKDAVLGTIQQLLKHGIWPREVCISSFLLTRWLEFHYNLRLMASQSPVVLVHLDTAVCDVVFCSEDHVNYARSLPQGLNRLNQAAITYLAEEISQTLDTYYDEGMGPELRSGVIISDVMEAEILAQHLTEQTQFVFQTHPAFDGGMTAAIKKRLASEKLNKISLCVSLAASLEDDSPRINLLPRQVSAAKERQTMMKEFKKAAAGIVILALMVTGWHALDYFKSARQLAGIQEVSDRIKTTVKNAERTIVSVEALEQRLSGRKLIVEVMDSIVEVMPDSVSLRNLTFSEGGDLTLEGYAESRASVSDFQRDLLNHAMFREARLQYSKKRRLFNDEITDFKIVARLY